MISSATNLIACLSVCSQLKSVAPTHVAIQRSEAAEESFARAAASFSVAA